MSIIYIATAIAVRTHHLCSRRAMARLYNGALASKMQSLRHGFA